MMMNALLAMTLHPQNMHHITTLALCALWDITHDITRSEYKNNIARQSKRRPVHCDPESQISGHRSIFQNSNIQKET